MLEDRAPNSSKFFRSDQCLGRSGPVDAFVEGAGNLGINSPDFPVAPQNLLLEVYADQGQERNHGDHRQSQLRVGDKHEGDGKDQDGQGPRDVHTTPGDDIADALGVGGHPGHNPAYRGVVVIGKAELLQMVEADLTDIVNNTCLKLTGLVNKHKNVYRLDKDKGNEARDKPGQVGPVAGADKIVDGVAGHLGKDGVPRRDQNVAAN